MAKQIKIFDTTLRDGEQSPGCSMNLAEKLEVARQLERLGVDVIEAGFPISSPDDFAAVQAIAGIIEHCTVAGLARATKEDIDKAYEAVKDAKHPRIHTFIATSDVHMEYKLKMTPEEVITRIHDMVSYAVGFGVEVEFSAEDASRTDRDFLLRAVNTAIDAGATVINIPDTVGYAMPEEMADLIRFLKHNIHKADEIELSVHCHNDLGLGVANSLASIGAGATQIECTINGIGERAGNASLEEIAMNLVTRHDYFDAKCNINTKQIYRSAQLICSITGVPLSPTKPITGANAFAHEAGIHQHGVLCNRSTYEIMSPESIGIPQNKMVLGKHSGKHAFADRLQSLGYTLSQDALVKAFDRFKRLADKKKIVSDRDIEALIGATNSGEEQPEQVKYVRYAIMSGNTIDSTVVVTLEIDGKEQEFTARSNGPIDACYRAIEGMLHSEAVLDTYGLQSVTEGIDAQAVVFVKMSKNGDTVTGRGLSTDIIEASIKAYLSALNKLL